MWEKLRRVGWCAMRSPHTGYSEEEKGKLKISKRTVLDKDEELYNSWGDNMAEDDKVRVDNVEDGGGNVNKESLGRSTIGSLNFSRPKGLKKSNTTSTLGKSVETFTPSEEPNGSLREEVAVTEDSSLSMENGTLPSSNSGFKDVEKVDVEKVEVEKVEVEEAVISFNGVSKEYIIKGKNKVSALKKVDFSVQPGEFVFLVGPSGSGKSTVLRLIIREEDATSGDIIVGKVNLRTLERNKIPSLRRQVGTVFQDFRLLNDRTVGENVAFTLKVLGETSGVEKKVIDTLALVGLADKVDRYPHELSGGEQQRAAIARAFVTNPPLLVADEPTGNLDPDTSEDIMSLLNMINLSGTTVLMATHDVNIVNSMNKRVIRLNGGNIVSDDAYGKY